jgi:uncharacterized membrane protein YjjP (DUF1212 family)/uncharacterized membrane protein YjjB (DUF3815 family)
MASSSSSLAAAALSASGSRQRLGGSQASLANLAAAPNPSLQAAPAGVVPKSRDAEEDRSKEAPVHVTRAQQLLRLATAHSRSQSVHSHAATQLAESEYCTLLAQLDTLRSSAEEASSSQRSRAAKRSAKARNTRTEDALMLLTRLLHNAGCPAWRLQGHVSAAARGVGVRVHVHVFPHHCTLTFSRRLTAESLGAKTLTVSTSPSLDVNALAKVDAVARRLSSYATSDVKGAAIVARNGDGDEAAVLLASDAGSASWERLGPKDVARYALDAASTGPGFWRDCDDDGDGASSSDGDGSDTEAGDVERGSAEAGEESQHLMATSAAPSQRTHGRAFDIDGEDADDADDSSPGARRRATFVAAVLDDCLPQLRGLHTAPPLYGPTSQCLASAIAAAGCALVFWSGSWYDGALAAACGGVVGILGLAFNGTWGNRAGVRRIAGYELCAAACVSLLTRFAAAAAVSGSTPPVCASAVRLGALQWLLQGWDITVAFIELTSRNASLCGASHLLVAVMVTALIGVGLNLGDTIADAAHLHSVADTASCTHGVNIRWYLPTFLVTSCALAVQCNAARQQLLPMVGISMVTFAISIGLTLVGNATLTSLSTLLAALAAGWLANVLANRTGRPAVGGAAIGVFTLVPDGMAELNGVTAALMHRGEGGLLASLTLTASIVQTCVTIGAGIFIASLLVSPRELTHTHGADEPAATGLGRIRAAFLGFGRRNRAPVGRRRRYGRSRALPLFF